MNKYKKLAIAAVSMVMAGTMVFSFAACGGDKGGTGGGGGGALTGDLTYDEGTELQLSIGYNNQDTGITFSQANATKMNGKTLMSQSVSQNTLKPAWAALEEQLKVSFTDLYQGTEASKQISTIKDTTDGLAGVTLLTASASTISAEAAGNADAFVDLSKYIDHMPNFNAFINAPENAVIKLSLINNYRTGAIYMAPYFDGNDDIEKFVLLRKDLVETLLDGKSGETLSTGTFADQASAKNSATAKPGPTGDQTVTGGQHSIESFMGKTGSWTVDTTDPSKLTGTPDVGTNKDEVSDTKATVKVKIDYDKALADAKDTATEGAIGKILSGISGVAAEDISGQTSGNIVDIMNLAIDKTTGAVTGGQLLQILRRYIDVAYTTEAGASFYATANSGLKRSDVFNSASAAWDVDLYAALGRVFVTCTSMLGSEVKDSSLTYLVAGREYTTQRTTDVASLAGELYGVRGLESRYNYSYIDKDGKVVDARANEDFFDAVAKINAFAKEGLFNTANNVVKDKLSSSSADNTGIQTLSIHDYVQTQTSAYGFGSGTYNFAPVLTPVSVWDEDCNAETSATGRTDGREKIMRFTESWRGVKDGGFVISKANVAGDENKLNAALALIDYFFSVDGQILMTYGPMSTTGNTSPDGLWYADEVTDKTAAEVATKITEATSYAPAQYKVKDEYKEQYFVYNEKVYSGTPYNGKNIPTLTSENLDVFGQVSGHNFTNHARQLLGTCLPLGNKDQGFEYQCTAPCGIVGSRIFNIALNNETIKHPFQTIDSSNYWYTLMPTQLPYAKSVSDALGEGNLSVISGLGTDNNNLYVSTSKTQRDLLLDLMYYGYNPAIALSYVTSSHTLPQNAAAAVQLNKDYGLEQLLNYKTAAWTGLLGLYNGNNQ